MIIDTPHNCRDDKRVISDIRTFGLHVVLIEATDYLPSFAYSIGLWQKYKHPEIISFGLTVQTLHRIINDVADKVRSGQNIEIGEIYNNFFDNGKVEFIKVDNKNIADYFGAAIDFYNSKEFPALQLVWSNRNNKLPWEADFEKEFIYRQPLLDRNTDFKFREAKNLGIFTTRQWLELSKPIVKVVHDIEGDWQFLTGDQFPEDARLVALEQMTLKDSTLNEVFDLDYGEEAIRECIGGKWTRNKVE